MRTVDWDEDPRRLPSPRRPREFHVPGVDSFSAGLRTCRLPTGSRFPVRGRTSARVSVRSCLPLRGSSGFSPDSLFSWPCTVRHR